MHRLTPHLFCNYAWGWWRILRHALVNNCWSYSNYHHQVDLFLQFGRLSPTVRLELWGGTERVYSDLCQKSKHQKTKQHHYEIVLLLQSWKASADLLSFSTPHTHADMPAINVSRPPHTPWSDTWALKMTKLCNLQAASMHARTHALWLHSHLARRAAKRCSTHCTSCFESEIRGISLIKRPHSQWTV